MTCHGCGGGGYKYDEIRRGGGIKIMDFTMT